MSDTKSREYWLEKAVMNIRPLFTEVGLTIPEVVHVSCGFPSVRGLNGRLGEHWNGENSKDGNSYIFVNPIVTESIKALEVLVHELVHACMPPKTKHGKLFKEAMSRVGLEGPPTSTWASEGLKLKLEEILEVIGDYPNVGLDPKMKEKKDTQTTRMRKLICRSNKVHEDDYIVRASSKVIGMGLPSCPCGAEMLVADEEKE